MLPNGFEKPEIVACRSHFASLYLAYAAVARHSGNFSDVGYDVWFSTVFDGGSGRTEDENHMWHVFAVKLGENLVEWTVLFQGRALKFEMSLDKDITGWPGASFSDLWKFIEARLNGFYGQSIPPAERFLSQQQIRFAEKFEKEYFSRWGQGRGSFAIWK